MIDDIFAYPITLVFGAAMFLFIGIYWLLIGGALILFVVMTPIFLIYALLIILFYLEVLPAKWILFGFYFGPVACILGHVALVRWCRKAMSRE